MCLILPGVWAVHNRLIPIKGSMVVGHIIDQLNRDARRRPSMPCSTLSLEISNCELYVGPLAVPFVSHVVAFYQNLSAFDANVAFLTTTATETTSSLHSISKHRTMSNHPTKSSTPFTINVSGKSEILHPAELAFINVSVTTSGPDKASVSKAVLASTQQLESLLQAIENSPNASEESPLAHWSKTSLSATSHIPYAHSHAYSSDVANKPPPARQYTSTITFDIRFRDFRVLGSFGSNISALPHVEVQAITWHLTPETEASYRSRLRKDAARDALVKARDYAGVLGYGSVRPVELSEGGAGAMFGEVGMARAAAFGGGGVEEVRDESPLEFKPEEVKMGMEVTVKFEASGREE